MCTSIIPCNIYSQLQCHSIRTMYTYSTCPARTNNILTSSQFSQLPVCRVRLLPGASPFKNIFNLQIFYCHLKRFWSLKCRANWHIHSYICTKTQAQHTKIYSSYYNYNTPLLVHLNKISLYVSMAIILLRWCLSSDYEVVHCILSRSRTICFYDIPGFLFFPSLFLPFL